MRPRRFTGNHDDDPRFDRENHWAASVRCRCGSYYRHDPMHDAARYQCEACDAKDAREEAEAGVEHLVLPLRLLTDDDERAIVAAANPETLQEQLLVSLVLRLGQDVKYLKQQVQELQHRQAV